MKLKFILAVAVSLLFLSGCGEVSDRAYDLTTVRGIAIAEGAGGYKAKGFASDFCVPEDIGADEYDAEGVNAAAFAVFDLSEGTVDAYSDIYERVYPASTTKILTCMIALERGDLDDIVTVSEEADIDVSGSSMANIYPGERLTLRDLLYGLMVPSGNDAAAAIACYISGSVASFAQLMNERARELGATQSHFVNPHGLPDEDHYTTVYDMYLIMNAALDTPGFSEFASQSSYTASVTGSDGTVREVTWTNGNGFLKGDFELPDGVSILAGKTGHTNAAGFCLVLAETSDDGKELLSVVFGADTYEAVYGATNALILKGMA